MPGTTSHRQVLDPRSLGEALRMLRDEGPLTPMAGCTDLYVSLNFGTLGPTRFLNLWRLDELRPIDRRRGRPGVLSIGALATYSDLIKSPLVGRHLPMLVAAAREVGAVQIQNRGTLGGNVANGSPAGDTLPVLAVVEAVVVLQSIRGTRRVPFATFYTGYRQTLMQSDELIVSFEIPPVSGRQWFRKVGTRAAQAISKVVVAGVAGPSWRLAAGSVAPTVVRLSRTETAISARQSPEEITRAVLADIRPIDDIRSTTEYRKRVTQNLVSRFLADTSRRT
jgi:CO/xanthine dehydrogenase FAD-binding subunit